MGSAGPDLPTRFPCWVRAVYSWGGETDKDLGFVEGDLIECLNAGDGQWWMGRLRRDKRMIGLFPSNFVIVMDESFKPVNRSTSPMPDTTSQIATTQPKKQARKPFSGYKTSQAPSRTPSAVSITSSPLKPAVASPGPQYDPANPPSTVLWNMGSHSRGPSRSPSPMPPEMGSSPPPPPPPPHRVLKSSQQGRPPSPVPLDMNDGYQTFSRTPSPRPPSLQGHTPPMLRDAMDDVMSSLEGMSTTGREPSPAAPFNPWSPEAFDEIAKRSTRRPNPRPLTSLGLEAGGSNYSERQDYSSRHNSPDRYHDGPPQLSNYVQRMESRLRQMQEAKTARANNEMINSDDVDPPAVPPKNSPWNSRPVSAMAARRPSIRNRKSAYELGKDALGRTGTTRTDTTNSSSTTNSSNQTSMTNQSIMSGFSAGGFSATSAGSLARRNKFGSFRQGRPTTASGTRGTELRPQTPLTHIPYQASHESRQGAQSAMDWESRAAFSESTGGLGGFSTVKAKKAGFFKKLVEGAKAGAASARSNISPQASPSKMSFNNGVTGIAGGTAVSQYGQNAAKEMGLDGGSRDWLNVRRDVNRSNTPGPMERQERADRCQMLDLPVISPVDELYETAEGDEGVDGLPVPGPFQMSNPSFTLVDKAAKFITSLPPMITPASLAQGYVCRPHRSDVQRLRAIFTWVSERIAWEDDFEGEIDSRRVLQTRRGCSRELAVLVFEMCVAVNIHAEVVRGYLKTPGEDLDLDAHHRPNHYWNAILVDDEWRMMDCSLASPTNPRRSLYSSISSQIAEPFYFLTGPLEFCYTHIPLNPQHQHIIPTISPDVLLSLPCALSPYFRQNLLMHNYDTSLIRLEGLEISTIQINVPPDIELVAEVEASSYLRDQDGDLYENGDSVIKKRALSQASWYTPPNNPHILQKRYIIKALLPSDEGVSVGAIKIYAGKRGLMHSSKDIPHSLAVALPIYHQGENPEYDFLTRHPTPHAMRQDLYLLQPQCKKLCVGETFVFTVRQHAASVVATPTIDQNGFDLRPVSPNPNPYPRPTSALSMTSSAAGSNQSSRTGMGVGLELTAKDKPAKLAIQSPGGKIIRLNRKAEHTIVQPKGNVDVDGEVQGSVWECGVKVVERGTWRVLVLADRSARWCVWGEWECV